MYVCITPLTQSTPLQCVYSIYVCPFRDVCVVCGVRHMVMPTVHIPMCHEPVEMYLCTACKHVNIRTCGVKRLSCWLRCIRMYICI